MPSTFDIGDLVTVTGKFSTSTTSTAYLDPTAIKFHMETPTGNVTSYSVSPPTTSADIIKSSTGEFYVEWLTTEHGSYTYRWTTTGVVDASEEASFLVRRRAVTT